MAGKFIALAAVLLAVAVGVDAHHINAHITARSSFSGNSGKDVVDRMQNTIAMIPVTMKVEKERSPEVLQKIREANGTVLAQIMDHISINGQDIDIPQVKSDKDSKQMGATLGSFAETLKSVTDEDTCNCDPKDSAASVKALIDATSHMSQELLRCLLASLKSTIKTREATLIRTIVRESMASLSRSVDGIYSIWKMDSQKRDLASVQAVIDGLMNVLNKFSSRLATAMFSDKKSRIDTVTFVVDSLVNLVANTSEAISRDVDAGLSEDQLDQIMVLAKDLAEPLTSSVLAEFVQGTARIPYINKLLLGYVMESQTLSKDCAHTHDVRVAKPKAVLKALSDGLRAMNIKVAASDPSGAASNSHRVATTGFLLSLIRQNEDILKNFAKTTKVNDKCRKRAGESLANIGAIVKSIVDNIMPDIKDSKNKQQTALAGDLSKDFVDILSVIGSNMAQPGMNTAVTNITNMIYQQYEVIRRVAKNDQAISRDSDAGIKSTISLLVDIARFEIKFVQVSIGRVRSSRDATLRYKAVRDVNLRIIKSAVTVARGLAPADNKPLTDLIKGTGDAVAEVINELESVFSKRPQTFGDVLYEVFYSILETQRKLVTSASSPSRSGLPTTVPSDVIFGLANAIRTAIDWSNALTRTSGMDRPIQSTLVKFVIDIVNNVQDSLQTEEKDNQNIDSSIKSDMQEVLDQMNKILKDIKSGVTTTTVASSDYSDYSDQTDVTPTSGISQIGSLVNKLDEILQYIIEGGLKPRSSIVTRNSEVVIHIISVVFDDVSRTPHVNEDGSVDLPSGTIKPCGRGGDSSDPSGMTTTPLPSSPETKPPQTTTAQPTTAQPTTARPTTARSTTVRSTTARSTTERPTTARSTTVRSTTARPTTARSTTARSTTARSTTARSTTARSTTARSTTARSTTARSTTARSTTARSTTARSTTARSTTARSTTARSTTVRSTTARPTTVRSTTVRSTTARPTTVRSTTSRQTTVRSTTARSTTAKSSTSRPASTTTVMPTGPNDTCEVDQMKRYLNITHLSSDDMQKLIEQIQDLVNKTASKDCKRNKMAISPAVSRRITTDVLKSLSVERSMICSA